MDIILGRRSPVPGDVRVDDFWGATAHEVKAAADARTHRTGRAWTVISRPIWWALGTRANGEIVSSDAY